MLILIKRRGNPSLLNFIIVRSAKLNQVAIVLASQEKGLMNYCNSKVHRAEKQIYEGNNQSAKGYKEK